MIRETGTPGPAKDYRELRVYKLAFESALMLHELSKAFPAEERYSLTDQMRRSSRSVCANVAEAWRKRQYPKSFVSKLSDAQAEATETTVWLDFAKALHFITTDAHRDLFDRYDHICRQLAIMANEPGKWTPAPHKVEQP
jgi:four helix bundle protein